MVRVLPIQKANGWHARGLLAAPPGFNQSVESTVFNGKYTVICRAMQPGHSLGIFYGANPFRNNFALILLNVVFVILFSKIVRILIKPLKQPRIVADFLGGIIIGPSVLGHSKKFASFMYPPNTDYIIKNLGIIALMYFLFISGVKMDLGLMKRSSRKHYYIATISVAFPFLVSVLAGFFLRPSMDPNLAKLASIGGVISSTAITTFPVIYIVLKELNLLNSEVGRFSLSLSIIGDAIGANAITIFEALKQGETNHRAALWYCVSVTIIIAFILIIVKRIMRWIVKKTPEGKPVEQSYIVAILLGVMVIGFLTDMFGVAIATGPLFFGLVIPDGPPLGSTLVDRSETLIMEVLMPFAYALVGLTTNVFLLWEAGWAAVAPLFALALTGYMCKFISTVACCLFFGTPVRDSLSIGLIISLRGQVELVLIIHWIDKEMIGLPGFAMMAFLTIGVTAIVTPAISFLYNPTRPYMVNKRRTIQHTPPCTPLNILLCIPDQDSITGLISLLEFSYPTISNPFTIFALELVELVGRATPVFIDHQDDNNPMDTTRKYTGGDSEAIVNALRLYQETRLDCVELKSYTSCSPRRTMYQDICELALVKKTAIILLPIHREGIECVVRSDLRALGLQTVNALVLSHSPCSIGIFYDKGHLQNPLVPRSMEHRVHHFAILFLGGADNREALHFSDRMTNNPDINLTVVRFLSHNSEGDDETEKKLDDGVVTWFWVKNESNERVIYREVVVRNGAETVAAIQAMNDITVYDLWVTGRRQGINQKLIEGLSTWSDDNQLGVIGECVASDDFGGSASVLVIHQQILRGQDSATGCAPGCASGCVAHAKSNLNHLIPCNNSQ